MIFYPFNIADFSHATRHLTRVERSIYRDMLDLYYDTEAPLTSDVKMLCRLLIINSDDEIAAVKLLLGEFFQLTEGGWSHDRCEREISKYHALIGAKSAAGKASAIARSNKNKQKNNSRSTGVQQQSNGTPTIKDVRLKTKDKKTPPNPPEGGKPDEPAGKFDPINACPENVSPEVWADWVSCRKDQRKPLNESTCKAQAQKLKDHPNPDQVIMESISAGWQGLFPDRVSNVHPIRAGKSTRPALKPGEFYDVDWDDRNPSTHKIRHVDTHDPTTGYAWAWLKKQTWYKP